MTSAEAVSEELAKRTRTLVLGGAAVIFHGLNRSTKDLDLWIDPGEWVDSIEHILRMYPDLSAVYLDDFTGKWEESAPGEIASIPNKGCVLRILGTDRPINIFHQPNEVELHEFDSFWNRSVPLKGSIRALDPIDLIITKQLTDRPHDQVDIVFLESKIESQMRLTLPRESYDYVEAQLMRFRSADVAFSATTNSDPRAQQLGWSILKELAKDGDPFAEEYLQKSREKS